MNNNQIIKDQIKRIKGLSRQLENADPNDVPTMAISGELWDIAAVIQGWVDADRYEYLMEMDKNDLATMILGLEKDLDS